MRTAIVTAGYLASAVLASEDQGFLQSLGRFSTQPRFKTLMSDIAPRQLSDATTAPDGDFYVEIGDTNDIYYTSPFAFGANL